MNPVKPHIRLNELVGSPASEIAERFPDTLAANSNEMRSLIGMATQAFSIQYLLDLVGGTSDSPEVRRLETQVVEASNILLQRQGRKNGHDTANEILDAIKTEALQTAITLKKEYDYPPMDFDRMTEDVLNQMYKDRLFALTVKRSPGNRDSREEVLRGIVRDYVRAKYLDLKDTVSEEYSPSGTTLRRLNKELHFIFGSYDLTDKEFMDSMRRCEQLGGTIRIPSNELSNQTGTIENTNIIAEYSRRLSNAVNDAYARELGKGPQK